MADLELDAIRRIDLSDDQTVVALMAPDCVYHEDPDWLDGRTFHGREEIAAALVEYREVWGTRSQEFEDVERVGDAVVASIRQRAVTPGAGVPVEHVWTFVFRLRDGRIAEMWAFADREAGLEQAARVSG